MLHFREPERVDPVTPNSMLPDEIYSVALDHLVIACVDVVLTCHNRVLLVERNHYPRSSWWVIGGRMEAGEDPKQTAIRKVAQELDMENLDADLDADRLQYIGTYSTCFAFRHQPPQHHGSHTINLTYHLDLTLDLTLDATPGEPPKIAVQPDYHQTWQWFTLEQAMCLLDTDQVMDRALLNVMQDLQPFLQAIDRQKFKLD